jgi:hypothetical protein
VWDKLRIVESEPCGIFLEQSPPDEAIFMFKCIEILLVANCVF